MDTDQAPARTCLQCGTTQSHPDRFCGMCGAILPALPRPAAAPPSHRAVGWAMLGIVALAVAAVALMPLLVGQPTELPSGTPPSGPAPQVWSSGTSRPAASAPSPGSASQAQAARPSRRVRQRAPTGPPMPGAFYVDLQPYATQRLSDGLHGDPRNSLGRLRVGKVHTGRSSFRVGPKYVHLRGENARTMPPSVRGIRVGAPGRAVHFLHACGYGGGAAGGQSTIREVACYTVHYADGRSAIVPVRYDYEISDWYDWGLGAQDGPAVAWVGGNACTDTAKVQLRLYSYVWRNPRPDIAIRAIDLESRSGGCDPFVLAITVDTRRP